MPSTDSTGEVFEEKERCQEVLAILGFIPPCTRFEGAKEKLLGRYGIVYSPTQPPLLAPWGARKSLSLSVVIEAIPFRRSLTHAK